jgi:hypothetical protein
LGVSRQNTREKIKRWMDNQHMTMWQGSYHYPEICSKTDFRSQSDCKARALSFKTQSRAVSDLLTGHNTLRRQLYLMGLTKIPLCRRCAAEEDTSTHVMCECEALAPLKHAYWCSFFLDPEGIRSLNLGGNLELQ